MKTSTIKRLLTFLFVLTLTVVQCLSVSAEESITFDSDGYTSTSEMTPEDKTDDYQKNYQGESFEDNESYSFTKSLYQTAEWTDKDDGEAELDIYYEVQFRPGQMATRSLYVFTNCTGHSFYLKTAVSNIIELLEYNEYVDVIMIGVNNRISYASIESSDTVAADVAATMMVTFRASDFEDITIDGLDYLEKDGGVVTEEWASSEYSDEDYSTYTKAGIIANILTTYTNAGLMADKYAHKLGCTNDDEDKTCCDSSGYTKDTSTDAYTKDSSGLYELKGDVDLGGKYYDDDNGSYGPYINVLYNVIDFSDSDFSFIYDKSLMISAYSTAAEFALSFKDQGHAGEVFTLYYIAEYIGIIESNYGGEFDTVVAGIFNSFDAFSTANRNTNQAFLTETLYSQLEKLISVDLGDNDTTEGDYDIAFSRDDLSQDCQDALSILGEYTTEGRYILLIPATNNSSEIYKIDSTMLDPTKVDIVSFKNALVYTLTIMNPNQPETNIKLMVNSIFDSIDSDSESSVTITWDRLQQFNTNIYTYTTDLKSAGALNTVYASYTATVETTITAEFAVSGTVTVTTSKDEEGQFYDDPTITVNANGTTTITVNFYDLDTEETDAWQIKISIPVTLKDNAAGFRTDEDDFKETKIGTTTATITSDSASTLSTEDATETVEIEPTVLYKAPTPKSTTRPKTDPDGSDDSEGGSGDDGRTVIIVDTSTK